MSHRLAYDTSYHNLSIVFVNISMFICVNYSKHSIQLTKSLLQQMVISIITVQLLPQQTTSFGSLHTPMFSLLFLS